MVRMSHDAVIVFVVVGRLQLAMLTTKRVALFSISMQASGCVPIVMVLLLVALLATEAPLLSQKGRKT